MAEEDLPDVKTLFAHFAPLPAEEITEFEAPFSCLEVTTVINESTNSKAVDADGLTIQIFKALTGDLEAVFLITECINEAY